MNVLFTPFPGSRLSIRVEQVQRMNLPNYENNVQAWSSRYGGLIEGLVVSGLTEYMNHIHFVVTDMYG